MGGLVTTPSDRLVTKDMFDIERIMEQYIASLMEYPGMHVRVRITSPKLETPYSNAAMETQNRVIELVKAEVIERTKEMLTMMGIEYEVSPITQNSLMIKEKPP